MSDSPLHDFSVNANACGPCPAALEALERADHVHYPERHHGALRQALADFHGVDAARVVLAGSAGEFAQRITAAVAQRAGRSVWVPTHCHADYGRAARAWGLELLRGGGASPAEARLMWCCDPSGPLGQPQPDLATLVDTHAGGRACVLDLAYEPLRLSGRIALDPAQGERVWQLWTPHHALGLAGVRAAYVIAPLGSETLVARLESLASARPLGADGVALLAIWVEDAAQRWLAASLPQLREWKAAQIALCEGLGWSCLPSETNFYCVRAGTRQPVEEVQAALLEAGVKVRDTLDFGLRAHLRLAVRPPESQRTLARALMRVSRGAA